MRLMKGLMNWKMNKFIRKISSQEKKDNGKWGN